MTAERREALLLGTTRSLAEGATWWIPYAARAGAYLGRRARLDPTPWKNSEVYQDMAADGLERLYRFVGLGERDDPDFQEGYLAGSILTLPVGNIGAAARAGARFVARHPRLTASALAGGTLFAANEADAGTSHDLGKAGEDAWKEFVVRSGGKYYGGQIRLYLTDAFGNDLYFDKEGRVIPLARDGANAAPGERRYGVIDGVGQLKDGRFTFGELKNGWGSKTPYNQSMVIEFLKRGMVRVEGDLAKEHRIDGFLLDRIKEFGFDPNVYNEGPQIARLRADRDAWKGILSKEREGVDYNGYGLDATQNDKEYENY